MQKNVIILKYVAKIQKPSVDSINKNKLADTDTPIS